MAGFAKSIVVAFLIVFIFILSINFVTFFTWYMVLAYEAFNLSIMSANHNFIHEDDAKLVQDTLMDKPIFREAERLRQQGKMNVSSTVEILGPIGVEDPNNPIYGQRGKQFDVGIRAVYPLKITMAGTDYVKAVDITVTFTTTGLKFYKYLPY